MLREINFVDEEGKEVVEEKVHESIQVLIPDNENLINDMKIEILKREKYSNLQTTFANDSLFARAEDTEGSLFAISVDGSNNSAQGFELVTTEFLKEKSSLLVIHVFSTEMDHSYNYQNKKDTVLYNYAARLIPYKAKSSFIVENRESKIHALEQVNSIVSNKGANFLVLGYRGIKGPKGCNRELSKGISYALGNAVSPVIIVKEPTNRKKTQTGGFRWCFIMDKQYSNCVRAFQAFSELVDSEKDFVFGYSLLPSYINFDLNKREFENEINYRGIKNYEYLMEEYTKDPGKMALEKVNHNNEGFDFVCIYNNPKRHKDNPFTNENVDIIKICVSNICFVNSMR